MNLEEAVLIKELIDHYYKYPPSKQKQLENWRENKEAFSEVLSSLSEKSTDVLVQEFDKKYK